MIMIYSWDKRNVGWFWNISSKKCILWARDIKSMFLNSLLYYEVPSIGFQIFFVQAFKIVIDSWKFSMLLLYILWHNWPIIMISGSNEQQQQQLEYTLLKPDSHSWRISKMQSGREDTLEERYAIKFYFKLGKNATETYGMLHNAFQPSCMNRASVFEWHNTFKEGKESVRDDERCGRSKESIHQSWLTKELGLGLQCGGFKGVQQDIPSEEASTLQIGSVAFPPGQCTIHNSILVTDYLTKMGIKTVPQPPYSPDLAPCDFGYSLSSEAVVMRQLRRGKRLWRRS